MYTILESISRPSKIIINTCKQYTGYKHTYTGCNKHRICTAGTVVPVATYTRHPTSLIDLTIATEKYQSFLVSSEQANRKKDKNGTRRIVQK